MMLSEFNVIFGFVMDDLHKLIVASQSTYETKIGMKNIMRYR